MDYVVYNEITGEIIRTGTCPPSMLLIQANVGESVIEGVANDTQHIIVNGIVTNKPRQE